MHLVPLNNPVVAFGSRDGRTEPDLVVRWLFVEDVCADAGNDNVEDAGLYVP